jgi:hypothetical protein
MADKSYLVVRFERSGAMIGSWQTFMFDAMRQARLAAQQLARASSGVAIVERAVDPETDDERLIAQIGAIPAKFPHSTGWMMRLN